MPNAESPSTRARALTCAAIPCLEWHMREKLAAQPLLDELVPAEAQRPAKAAVRLSTPVQRRHRSTSSRTGSLHGASAPCLSVCRQLPATGPSRSWRSIAVQDADAPDEVAGTGASTSADLLIHRSFALRVSVAPWKLQVVSVVDEMIAFGNLVWVVAILMLATGPGTLALTVSEVTSTRGPCCYEPDVVSERRTTHNVPRPLDATLPRLGRPSLDGRR